MAFGRHVHPLLRPAASGDVGDVAEGGEHFTVPLCRKHHRDLHDDGNEAAWWHDMGIEPLDIAKDLWEESEKTRQMFANPRLDEVRPTITGETRTPPVGDGAKHAVD